MPVDCQIDDCGVLAVGRCQVCDRAFCGSHQAYEGRVRLTDQCSSCQNDRGERETQAKQAKWQAFLDNVRACEVQPFRRLLAGAVLKDNVYPPQPIPWCLYDPQLGSWASLSDRDMCSRIARDFVDEAQGRGVEPEWRVRSERSVKKGFLQRLRVERSYDHGWVVPGGSNRRSGGKSDGHLAAIIWIDGVIGTDFPVNSDGGGLHDGSLATMAGMLGINTVPRS